MFVLLLSLLFWIDVIVWLHPIIFKTFGFASFVLLQLVLICHYFFRSFEFSVCLFTDFCLFLYSVVGDRWWWCPVVEHPVVPYCSYWERLFCISPKSAGCVGWFCFHFILVDVPPHQSSYIHSAPTPLFKPLFFLLLLTWMWPTLILIDCLIKLSFQKNILFTCLMSNLE